MDMIKVRQKRIKFNLMKSVRDLEIFMDHLPEIDVVYKFVSNGKFSSASFIKFIADRSVIREMYVSSFRIGQKELCLIDLSHRAGKIGMCHFAVGTLMCNDSKTLKRYKYYDNFKGVCEKNGWEYITVNNHSKILIFDTDDGKFVLETSSNLNENPKIEQFSFEQSEELYDFYKEAFELWRENE